MILVTSNAENKIAGCLPDSHRIPAMIRDVGSISNLDGGHNISKGILCRHRYLCKIADTRDAAEYIGVEGLSEDEYWSGAEPRENFCNCVFFKNHKLLFHRKFVPI